MCCQGRPESCPSPAKSHFSMCLRVRDQSLKVDAEALTEVPPHRAPEPLSSEEWHVVGKCLNDQQLHRSEYRC